MGQAKRKRALVAQNGGDTPDYPAPNNDVPDELASLIKAFSRGHVIIQGVFNDDGYPMALKSDRDWAFSTFDLTDADAYQLLLDEMPDDEIFFERVSKPEFPFMAVICPHKLRLFVEFTEDDGFVTCLVYTHHSTWQNGLTRYRFRWNSMEVEIQLLDEAVRLLGATVETETEAAIAIYQLYQARLWLEAREVPTTYVMSSSQKRASFARVANGLSAISPVRVISLSAVQKVFIRVNGEEGSGTGSRKSPHDRAGHKRIWKGKIINVRPSKIHGGAQGARITKVIP